MTEEGATGIIGILGLTNPTCCDIIYREVTAMPRARKEGEIRTSWFLKKEMYDKLRIIAIKKGLNLEELYVWVMTEFIEKAEKEGLL